jgi:hypothetical protein
MCVNSSAVGDNQGLRIGLRLVRYWYGIGSVPYQCHILAIIPYQYHTNTMVLVWYCVGITAALVVLVG